MSVTALMTLPTFCFFLHICLLILHLYFTQTCTLRPSITSVTPPPHPPQINAGTELALRYNDVSPLENHHCSVAFSILQEAETNILRGLTAGEQRRARDGIIRCILATDMARHNEIIGQFREIIDEFDYSEPVHVNLVSWARGVRGRYWTTDEILFDLGFDLMGSLKV